MPLGRSSRYRSLGSGGSSRALQGAEGLGFRGLGFFPESIAKGSSVQSPSEKVHRIKYTEDQVHSVIHRLKCRISSA